jgi:hypothetical protein
MSLYDSATRAALAAGPVILRDMVAVYGKDSDGDPVTFGFWKGEDNITTNIVTAVDGSTVSRSFIGGGSLIGVDAIPLVIGLEARTIEVTLSPIHSEVQDMVRGNDIRHAVVEVLRAMFDVSTGGLVSTPFARFLGKVDGAPVATPAEGDEGSITLHCVSNTIELTRTNPARKSDEQQKRRSGDRFRKYADTAGDIEIWWGETKKRGRH